MAAHVKTLAPRQLVATGGEGLFCRGPQGRCTSGPLPTTAEYTDATILSLHERAFPCVGGLRKAEAVDLFRRFYDRDNTKVPSDRRGDTRRKRKKAGAGDAS